MIIRLSLAGIVVTMLLVPLSNAQENPAHKINWRRIARVTLYAAAIASSAAATYEGHECRVRNGVEPCTAHYGEFWATEGARGGLTGAMVTVSWGLHKSGWKGWFLPALGDTAFNTATAIGQSRKHAAR